VAQAAGGSGRPTGALRWAHLLTGPNDNSGTVVRDRDGGFLAMVNFVGSIDLGEGPVLAPGGSSSAAVALARYDVQGRLRWVKVLGAPPDLQGRAFGFRHAVDRHRNIILFLDADNVDFGEGAVLSGLILVKLDPKGRRVWSRGISTEPGSLNVARIVMDRDDNIALAGVMAGTVDFGRGPLSTREFPVGSRILSAFLSKYSPSGENLWTFLDVENQSDGLGAAVDSRGNFLLCGSVITDVQTEPFVLMLSPEGAVRWVRRLEGALGFARSVATHGNRVVVVGTFAFTFTFAGRAHTASVNGDILQDAFVAAFTRDGEERWAWNFGFSVEDVAMDERDGVVVVGSYEAGSGDLGVLGPLPGNPATLANVYVAKFNRVMGEPLWSRGFTASGPDRGSPGLESASLAVTKEGRAAVLGQFSGTLTVGAETLEAEGSSDLFLLGCGSPGSHHRGTSPFPRGRHDQASQKQDAPLYLVDRRGQTQKGHTMKKEMIIRAWKDPVYRASLSEEQRSQLPENPPGRSITEIDEEHLFLAAGGRPPPMTSKFFCR
jgi:mersacidin/lichenicidin family type 2 lantibiotic